MRKYKFLVSYFDAFEEGQVVTFDELIEYGTINNIMPMWDGNDNTFNSVFLSKIKEVKEMTLVEKVMEHLGVENGEEFNINSGWYNPYNPYTFRDNKVYDRDNNLSTSVLGKLVIGTYTIEKIHKKSEQQLEIERTEQKLKEAQEELQKAKEM